MTPEYELYRKGQLVGVHDAQDGSLITMATVVATGTDHATITTRAGHTQDIPYSMLRQAGVAKRAAAEVLREEEQEGKVFKLIREETNTDGQLVVQFKVLLNDEPISESEELVTNVYDNENGWSAPDDFDENKVELVKSTYESGFDLLVDSYNKIADNITEEAAAAQAEAEAPAEPEGEPAFAPGAEGAAPEGEGDAGGEAGGEVDEGNLAGGPDAEAAPAGEEAPAEAPADAGEVTSASLERTSFARSILSGKAVKANDLLRNPQHRLNPVLRSEMDKRHIDSGEINDIDLAEELKDFDF